MQYLDAEHEATLLAKARQDNGALRELYDHYFPRVYGYIVSRVGRISDAEDLVSATFLTLIEALDHFEYRGEGSFAAWLFRIALNQVRDFYRQNQRRPAPVTLDGLPELPAMVPPPDELIVRRETFASLHDLIATLSPRRQEVILLKFFGGLRNREIAEVLQLDERTVAAYLCRSLEELYRKCMDAHIHRGQGEFHE